MCIYIYLCVIFTAVSYEFVAEIKGSEQQAARSGVCLLIARRQPPPKKKLKNGYGNRHVGPVWRVVGLSAEYWGSCSAFRSDPLPFCAAKSTYRWEFATSWLPSRPSSCWTSWSSSSSSVASALPKCWPRQPSRVAYLLGLVKRAERGPSFLHTSKEFLCCGQATYNL